MSDIGYKIYGISITLLFFGFFVYIMVWATSSRFRFFIIKWRTNLSPKVRPIIQAFIESVKDFTIWTHDSFFAPILLVFVFALFFEEVYPIINGSQNLSEWYRSVLIPK